MHAHADMVGRGAASAMYVLLTAEAEHAPRVNAD